MVTSFDHRPRFLQCSVEGCEENTAGYLELQRSDVWLDRAPICEVHLAKLRADPPEPQLLAGSRIQHLALQFAGGSVLDGAVKAIEAELQSVVEELTVRLHNQAVQIKQLREDLAKLRHAPETPVEPAAPETPVEPA